MTTPPSGTASSDEVGLVGDGDAWWVIVRERWLVGGLKARQSGMAAAKTKREATDFMVDEER